jgi:hypothetical protein
VAGFHVSPHVSPGIATALDRPRHDGLAAGAHHNLLVDHLHRLLAAAGASLDRQHGVVESTHQLAGRVQPARLAG